MKRIALFGGSFNPPTLRHTQMAARLAEDFDEVLVIPCGARPDKPTVDDTESRDRAALVDLAFGSLERVSVLLFDLERSQFTNTADLANMFRSQGEIWLVVGADLVRGGAGGCSAIQTSWLRGKQLWKEECFAVFERSGVEIEKGDLPPRSVLLPEVGVGCSEQVRQKVFHGECIAMDVPEAVHAFIERYALYRGRRPRVSSELKVSGADCLLVVDEMNPQAVARAQELPMGVLEKPHMIVALGGDGTMLSAIREHWRLRVPFYGINAGHLGFLLNGEQDFPKVGQKLKVKQLPLLWVETESLTGQTATALAFNDAWVERCTGQTAWIEVRVDGVSRLPKLVADGVLVATAAGSASYARAMGAVPVPLDTQVLLVVGSNVFRPNGWRNAMLPLQAEVEFNCLDPDKRPLLAFVDGQSLGEVRRMKVRISRTASVELAFEPSLDLSEKLARVQYAH